MKRILYFISLPLILFLAITTLIILVEIVNLNIILLYVILLSVFIPLSILFFVLKERHLIAVCIIILPICFYTINCIQKIYVEYDVVKEEIKYSRQIVGRINDFVINKKEHKEFVFKVYGINSYGLSDYKKVKPFNVLVKVKGIGNYNLNRWDVLIIEDKITIPQQTVGNFAYRKYLFYKKVYGLVKVKSDKIKIIEKRIGSRFYEDILKLSVWSVRSNFLLMLRNNLNEETYSFILSIFFGIRSEMEEDVYLDFQSTGMVHLLAISGMNISFIGGIFLLIFSLFFSKSVSFIISTLFLFLYILMIPQAPSSDRAFIMYLVQSLYYITGMRTIGFSILSISGIFLICCNPFSIFDLGFQLSFFATAGILLFSKVIEDYIIFVIPKKIKSTISVTLSAFFSVFLLQWAMFKKIQFFALLTSLILVPLFECLFVFLFFVMIIYYVTDLLFLKYLMEFLVSLFLDLIKIVNCIPPLNMPEIPLFISYLSLPLMVVIFYLVIPLIGKLLKRISPNGSMKLFFLSIMRRWAVRCGFK